MNAPTYKFEVFEGPLDLLLSLIEKHKIDIYDIKISLLLEQYIIYMQSAKENNWNLTADFIEMAARLMYIKSYTLLPPKENENEEDPKADLEILLQEYAKIKQISHMLRDEYIGSRIFFREVIPTNLPKPEANYSYKHSRLEEAYKRVIMKYAARNINSSNFSPLIGTKFISVNSKIIYVLRTLRKNPRTEFVSLFKNCKSRSEIVATFLAVLELIRGGRLDMDENNDEIYLYIIDKKNLD